MHATNRLMTAVVFDSRHLTGRHVDPRATGSDIVGPSHRAVTSRHHPARNSTRLAQNAIMLFLPVKFNFCQNRSATKFLRVKTSSGKVVATSFPLYNGPQMDGLRATSHLPKICAQSDLPLQKTPIRTDFA